MPLPETIHQLNEFRTIQASSFDINGKACSPIEMAFPKALAEQMLRLINQLENEIKLK